MIFLERVLLRFVRGTNTSLAKRATAQHTAKKPFGTLEQKSRPLSQKG